MKKILIISLAVAAFGIAATSTYADDTHHPQTEAQKSYSVIGEVVAVDKTAGRVKLKHEAVPELNWPGMTMFFAVSDKTQLDILEVGNRIEFQFVKDKDGAPLITQIKSVE